MMTPGLLSDEVLTAAFRTVPKQPDFAKKLEWWLLSPHAAERWIQFELAYALNQVYDGRHIVACEYTKGQQRADFAVFDAAGRSPIWENEPVALIELKFLGNWWVQPRQIGGYHADIAKVGKYSTPSLALAYCIEVCGQSKGDHYDWCFNQIDTAGRSTFDEMLAALRENSPGQIDCITEVDLTVAGLECFSSMRQHLCVYRNEHARTTTET